MTSWKKPTAESVDKATTRFVVPTYRRYFLDRLKNPEWIGALAERGCFQHPPRPERLGDEIRFPVWPESRYLRRMATLRPEPVAELLGSIDTDNITVLADIAEAALKMPVDNAVDLVEPLVRGADLKHRPYNYDGLLGQLALNLAEGRRFAEALHLFELLMRVVPDPRAESENSNAIRLWDEPIFDLLTQGFESRFFGDIVPGVAAVAPKQVLTISIRALSKHHACWTKQSSHYETPANDSCLWRPAIEEHVQNSSDRPSYYLVNVVRDAAARAIAAAPSELSTIVQQLESCEWRILHRVALHLIGRFAEAANSLIVERLASRELFDNTDYHHEYYILLEGHFSELPEEVQGRILSWIQDGPDPARSLARRSDGVCENAEDVHEILSRLRWLYAVRKHLPLPIREEFEHLRATHGDPKHPGFLRCSHPVEVFTDFGSPVSADELSRMTVREIVQLLSSWEPDPGSWFANGREGLASAFSEVVRSQADRFSREAMQFQDLDLHYQTALLGALEHGAKDGHAGLSWEPILEFCLHILSRLSQSGLREGEGHRLDMREERWLGVAIARVVQGGLRAGEDEIDVRSRDSVWLVIRRLCESRDPADHNQGSDVWMVAHGSPRGLGLELAILYALWIHRHAQSEGTEGSETRSFDTMPEVARMLERKLDARDEPLIALRSLYGEYFPQLLLLDQRWVRSNISLIFPKDHKPENRAAWATFVTSWRPSDEMLELLRAEYRHAIDQMGQAAVTAGDRDPDKGLAQHLLQFYWRGALSLGEDDQLLERFFDIAGFDVREHAVEFVGRELRLTESAVPTEYTRRLELLWVWRLEEAEGSDDAAAFGTELRAFISWLSARKFDDGWALEQFGKTLEVVGGGEQHIYGLWTTLRELALEHPLSVVRILGLVVGSENGGESIPYAGETIIQILESVLKSGHVEAAAEAREIAEDLGRRYYVDGVLGPAFRGLLPATGV